MLECDCLVLNVSDCLKKLTRKELDRRDYFLERRLIRAVCVYFYVCVQVYQVQYVCRDCGCFWTVRTGCVESQKFCKVMALTLLCTVKCLEIIFIVNCRYLNKLNWVKRIVCVLCIGFRAKREKKRREKKKSYDRILLYCITLKSPSMWT